MIRFLLSALLLCASVSAQVQYPTTVTSLEQLAALQPAIRSAFLLSTNTSRLFIYFPNATDATNSTTIIKPNNHGGRWIYGPFPGSSGGGGGGGTNSGFRFSITAYGADDTGVSDSTSAISDTITAASAAGNGVVYVPEGTFLLSSLDLTASNFRIEGPGTIKASGIVTNWIKITGTNGYIGNGVVLDGDSKAQVALCFGPYSSDWVIEGSTIQNPRVTALNDPLNTVLTGSATSAGIKMMTGVKRIKIRYNQFLNIGYDGLKNSTDHGTGRIARGILGAPFPAATTYADAVTDIEVVGNWFINSEADKSLIDADAICFQNSDTQTVPDCRIRVEDNYIDYWGWRGGKFQISGATVKGNTVVSRTPQAYGVASGGYFRTMRDGFLFTGSNNDISGNHFLGNAMGSAIDIASTDLAGRCTNSIVSGNVANLDGTLMGSAYVYNFESLKGGQINGNSWNCGFNGILLRGWCQNLSLYSNRGISNVFAGIYTMAETQSNTWTNQSPDTITIGGTVVNDSLSWGINAAFGTNITIIGTQGNAPVLVTYGSGVTGERAANRGSIEPITAKTSNTNYFFRIDADTSNPHVKFTGPFENTLMTWNLLTDVVTFGRSSGALNLAGPVTIAGGATLSGGATVSSLTVNDDAYGSGWNGSTNVPTKNALYDKIEAILLGGGLGTGDIDTSAELRNIISDETGTGFAVFNNTPTFVTPILGAATATSVAASGSITVGDVAYDQSTWNGSTAVPTRNAVRDELELKVYTTAIDTSAELAGILGDETGTGAAVFATSPTLVTPALGDATATTITVGTSGTGTLDIGSAGVRLSDDGDGALTILGLGNGSDESLTLNFDDTANTVVVSSSTGVTTIDTGTIGIVSTKGSVDLGTTMSANNTYAGNIRSGLNNSGGVSRWDVVYLNPSSQWVKADADGSGTYPATGIAIADAAGGAATTVLTRGTIRYDTWNWTPGGTIFLSTTAGGLTQTAPSTADNKVQVIGYALDADTMAVTISPDYGTVGGGSSGSVDDTAFASSWNGVTTIAPSKNVVYDWGHLFDTDDDGKVNVLDIGAGIPKTDSSGVVSVATAGTDYTTPSSTESFTNKTLDAAATGNVLKFTDYKDFVFPSRVDGAGCTIVTNDYTSALWGLATYSGTADTNGNYAVFRIGTVPYDLDTSAAMTLKGFSIRVSASDTDAAEFTIALYSPASSSGYSPTDFTGFSTFINFDSGTLTSPASNDIFYFSDVTLTGWAAALTAGRPFIIGIARRNGSNDDSVTIVSGTIEYGRTK